jgi:hypothetical protein
MKQCTNCSYLCEDLDTSCKNCGTPFDPAQQAQQAQQESVIQNGPIKTNGLAVASLVLGIVGILPCCYCIPSILAIIFGCVSKSSIKKSSGSLGGNGMATAGLVLGIIGLVFGVVMYIVLFSAGGMTSYMDYLKNMSSNK